MRHTQIVFGDLKHYFDELHRERESPAKVRRNFKNFIILTQQLTDTMRKEFSDLTGQKWEAKTFTGWNNVTTLFKELRNTEAHAYPITIKAKIDSSYFEEVALGLASNEQVMTRFFGEDNPENRRCVAGGLVISHTSDVGDPFSEVPPPPLVMSPCDSATGEALSTNVEPYRVDVNYALTAKGQPIEDLLLDIGTNDIHILCARCFYILEQYFNFYEDALKAGTP